MRKALATMVAALSVAGFGVLAAGGPAPASVCPSGYQLLGRLCIATEHPEPFLDVAERLDQMNAMNSTPPGVSSAQAYGRALRQRAALAGSPRAVAGSTGTWTPYGK